MLDKKYNKILTVVLVIVVLVIFGLLGFWGYETFQKFYGDKERDTAFEEFNNTVRNNTRQNTTQNGSDVINFTAVGGDVEGNSTNSKNKVQTYKGFTVLGTIEIPEIELKLPVLERATKYSLEASVGILMGPGLNKVGNTLIVGHNYRNGTFFSKNKDLKNGDLVYITDTTGERIKYTIYNIYTTSSEDTEYMTRDTAGKRELSLSTCTDDSKYRLVIWAKED